MLAYEDNPNSSTKLEVKGHSCSNLEILGSSVGISRQLTGGQLAKRTGVATSALHFYKERGLIRSERNASSHRRYARPTARRVASVVFVQRVGLTLEEIRSELEQAPHGSDARSRGLGSAENALTPLRMRNALQLWASRRREDGLSMQDL